MPSLILLNKLTIFLLYLAALLFVGGVSLALFVSPGHVPQVLAASLLTVIVTIPVSLFCLVSACKKGCISHSYVVFSVLISFLIAGLGWVVIPFALRRDLRDHLNGSPVTD